MLRLAGIGCVFLFCAVVGNNCARAFETEYKRICKVCDMLFDIKSCIGFEGMTLGEIIKHLQGNSEYDKLSFISCEYDENDLRYELLLSIERTPVFKNNEYNERLSRLFRLLGTTDKQTQLELISGCITYFDGQAELLREQLAVKKRLYNSLGIASGALVSIILL